MHQRNNKMYNNNVLYIVCTNNKNKYKNQIINDQRVEKNNNSANV